jgi:hypothetical protein
MPHLRRALLALLVPAALSAQDPGRAAFDSAAIAWDDGRFDEALARFERLLTGADAERWRDTIAVLTGERYRTYPVAPHGNRALWSADGRWAAVEHGARWASSGGRARLFPFDRDSTPRVTFLRPAGDSLAAAYTVEGWSTVFLGGGDRAARLVGEPGYARIVVRDLATGGDYPVAVPGLHATQLADAGDGRLLVVHIVPGDTTREGRTDLLAVDLEGRVDTLAAGTGLRVPVGAAPGLIVWRHGLDRFGVRYPSGAVRIVPGSAAAVAENGSGVVFQGRDAGGNTIIGWLPAAEGAEPRVLKRTAMRIGGLAVSADGRTVAFQAMPREDWELYAIGTDGAGERRLTTDVQDDQAPVFLTADLVLGRRGEGRHTRSYVWDARAGGGFRLFHNNTVRTITMEYGWAAAPGGRQLLVIADREGDNFDPARAVYLTRLDRPLDLAAVLARVRANLAAERALRERVRRLYAPVSAPVRAATQEITAARIRRHQERLSQFGSRDIRAPGNRLALAYLADELTQMGYVPERQDFEPRAGVTSTNLWVTIRGTTNPDQVYVVSSHFDSEEDSPGADDNGSGTSALLEVARVLRGRPQAATIILLWVNAEEVGLLGAHAWARRAKAEGMRVVANINNDTFGWARTGRLEATARFSNPAMRDVEHGAALLFSDLVTFEARFFHSSDGRAFWDAFGDIVGGFGSYPVLASPHYHEPHDAVETINPALIAEVAKATTASVMLLASGPAPVTGLSAQRRGSGVAVSWDKAPEREVTGYRVAYGPPEDPARRTIVVRGTRAVLPGVAPGTRVQVRAFTARGLESWDWARTTIEGGE